MARKKPAAPVRERPAPAPAPTPLGRIAASFGVHLADVEVAADLWSRHHRYEHVDADLLAAYAAACGRMVTADGRHVAQDVVDRVRVLTKEEAGRA